ncbi:glycosyltransferase [Algoriphagus yeomjeoni]|uniref:glycosyltransferase n=1 Tax=Algoriphagus yeomjeoni TaxID=291403 RepID=UPI003CE5C5ED
MSIEVSVILLSYNHEKYISFAIESILNQRFNQQFEIIILDDFSTDSTFEIINQFEVEFPEKLKSYKNSKNLGLARNYEKAILLAQGKYIAYLEGDDYWTDPLKLQKQFNFLEENPGFVLAFHDFITIDKGNNIISNMNLFNRTIQKNRSQKEMVTGCLIHQNTMMFRNVVTKFPSGFFRVKNHDTFFIAYLSKWGKAGYVKCNPMHYRIHSESLWSSLSGKKKHLNGLITYSIIIFYVSPKYFGNLIWKIGSKIKSILKS